MLTSPLANQNHRPSPYPYRCLACVSLAWPVQGAKEVGEAEMAGPVSLGHLLDRESPAGEWVLQPETLLNQTVSFIKQAGTVFNRLLMVAALGG